MPAVPIGLLLKRLSDCQQPVFGERSADELQSRGESVFAKAVGDRECRDAGGVAGSADLRAGQSFAVLVPGTINRVRDAGQSRADDRLERSQRGIDVPLDDRDRKSVV